MSNYKLLSVHVMSRHGDRNPTRSYTHNSPVVPNAHLTERGAKRAFNVGQSLHDLYFKTGIIDNTLSDSHIQFRSTNYQRTIASMRSIIQALAQCQNEDDPKLINLYKKIYVPEPKDDQILLGQLCAEGTQLIANSADQPRFRKLKRDSSALLNTMFEAIHEKQNNGWYLAVIIDAVIVERENGAPLLPSLDDSMMAQLRQLRNDMFFSIIPFSNPKYAEVALVPFYREVFVQHFDEDNAALSRGDTRVRYRHYLSHDLTMIGMLGFLGIDLTARHPNYSATVIFETYVSDDHINSPPYVLVHYCHTPPLEGPLTFEKQRFSLSDVLEKIKTLSSPSNK
ncbi:hypothetical protein BLNAU_12735 [Blattamonas nauphoetae]|uniref:Uncharacterized protein n=1 Tax=Blattamonas nauphoetae TaxID=2049346 RepID=A0ABQ9XLH0_9EUKA|nr:hypothetical protein BLNAU_12735 [Blattamonas nauphoetae]